MIKRGTTVSLIIFLSLIRFFQPWSKNFYNFLCTFYLLLARQILLTMMLMIIVALQIKTTGRLEKWLLVTQLSASGRKGYNMDRYQCSIHRILIQSTSSHLYKENIPGTCTFYFAICDRNHTGLQ